MRPSSCGDFQTPFPDEETEAQRASRPSGASPARPSLSGKPPRAGTEPLPGCVGDPVPPPRHGPHWAREVTGQTLSFESRPGPRPRECEGHRPVPVTPQRQGGHRSTSHRPEPRPQPLTHLTHQPGPQKAMPCTSEAELTRPGSGHGRPPGARTRTCMLIRCQPGRAGLPPGAPLEPPDAGHQATRLAPETLTQMDTSGAQAGAAQPEGPQFPRGRGESGVRPWFPRPRLRTSRPVCLPRPLRPAQHQVTGVRLRGRAGFPPVLQGGDVGSHTPILPAPPLLCDPSPTHSLAHLLIVPQAPVTGEELVSLPGARAEPGLGP